MIAFLEGPELLTIFVIMVVVIAIPVGIVLIVGTASNSSRSSTPGAPTGLYGAPAVLPQLGWHGDPNGSGRVLWRDGQALL